MAAGTSHFKSALHIILTFDFREIQVETAHSGGKQLAGIDTHRLQFRLPLEQQYHLLEILCAIHLKAVDHSGLRDIGLRHHQTPEAQFPGFHRHGENPFHRKQRAVEA